MGTGDGDARFFGWRLQVVVGAECACGGVGAGSQWLRVRAGYTEGAVAAAGYGPDFCTGKGVDLLNGAVSHHLDGFRLGGEWTLLGRWCAVEAVRHRTQFYAALEENHCRVMSTGMLKAAPTNRQYSKN